MNNFMKAGIYPLTKEPNRWNNRPLIPMPKECWQGNTLIYQYFKGLFILNRSQVQL